MKAVGRYETKTSTYTMKIAHGWVKMTTPMKKKGILHINSIVQNVIRSSRLTERHHYPDKGHKTKQE
jgi:hypothetical protein